MEKSIAKSSFANTKANLFFQSEQLEDVGFIVGGVGGGTVGSSKGITSLG